MRILLVWMMMGFLNCILANNKVSIYNVEVQFVDISVYSIDRFVEGDDRSMKLTLYHPSNALVKDLEVNFLVDDILPGVPPDGSGPFLGAGKTYMIESGSGNWYIIFIEDRLLKEGDIKCFRAGKLTRLAKKENIFTGYNKDGVVCDRQIIDIIKKLN